MLTNGKREYLEGVTGEGKKHNNKNKKEDNTVETRKEGITQQRMEEREKVSKENVEEDE